MRKPKWTMMVATTVRLPLAQPAEADERPLDLAALIYVPGSPRMKMAMKQRTISKRVKNVPALGKTHPLPTRKSPPNRR
uniref:Putative secreted protein n=1 Tax=Anopheles darlingi TaxID=43151 RepID=A0A2M4DER7_ANODA